MSASKSITKTATVSAPLRAARSPAAQAKSFAELVGAVPKVSAGTAPEKSASAKPKANGVVRSKAKAAAKEKPKAAAKKPPPKPATPQSADGIRMTRSSINAMATLGGVRTMTSGAADALREYLTDEVLEGIVYAGALQAIKCGRNTINPEDISKPFEGQGFMIDMSESVVMNNKKKKRKNAAKNAAANPPEEEDEEDDDE